MSLEERAYSFNAHWSAGLPEAEHLKVHELRAYYHRVGVTLQRVMPRLGRPILQNLEVQSIELEAMKQRVMALEAEGREILYLDESTFNANAYIERAWAKKKRPLQKVRRFVVVPVVAVIGVISAARGLVHCHYKQRSCNQQDML